MPAGRGGTDQEIHHGAPKGNFAKTLRQKDMVWTALWKDKEAPMKQSLHGRENLSGKKTEMHRRYDIRIGSYCLASLFFHVIGKNLSR